MWQPYPFSARVWATRLGVSLAFRRWHPACNVATTWEANCDMLWIRKEPFSHQYQDEHGVNQTINGWSVMHLKLMSAIQAFVQLSLPPHASTVNVHCNMSCAPQLQWPSYITMFRKLVAEDINVISCGQLQLRTWIWHIYSSRFWTFGWYCV